MAIVPSGSLEAAASKLTCSPIAAGLGEAAKVAVGAWFCAIEIVCVVVPVAPSLSVTRRPTLTLASVAYVWLAVGVVPVLVS